MKISFLNTVFVRTPLYSLEKFLEIPKSENELQNFVENLWRNNEFKDALYIGSPDLYYQWKKSIEFTISKSDLKKIGVSVLKYYIRATSRPTPFGLFSAYSLTQFNSSPKIRQNNYERFSSLDLSILYKIVRKLNSFSEIRNVVKFRLNSTIYKVGNDYRYIEVKFSEKREHVISKIEGDEVIQLLFSFLTSNNEITKEELSNFFMNTIEDVTRDDISQYIDELIDSQIIVSNFDISINEPHPLDQVIKFLDKHIRTFSLQSPAVTNFNVLKNISKLLKEIDETVFEENLEKYNQIYLEVQQILEEELDKKYIVNSNLKRSYPPISIDLKDKTKITKSINILSHLTDLSNNSTRKSDLSQFKDNFYKRYEEETVPLNLVLDNELGIGYKQNKSFIISDLLDGLDFATKKDFNKTINYNETLHLFWNKRLLKAYNKENFTVNLTDDDLNSLDLPQYISLPQTFSALYSKLNDKILLETISTGSATNLLGRFSSLDSKTAGFIDEIVSHEMNESDSIIHCELLHVQDDRTGNILARSVSRNSEIAFLTLGSEKVEQISLDDIYICLRHNKIKLFSKKFNKEIKIYNSTAHNYNYNSLPIYQFLSDIQHQDYTNALHINFGSVNENAFQKFPRITYGENIILSLATWKISLEDLESITENSLQDYIKSEKIPQYFCIVNGDHKLLIDYKNPILLSVVLNELKKMKHIKIQEFIYDVKEENYVNEIILSVKNEVYKANASLLPKRNPESINVQRKFIPGDSWIYYKIYTGVKTANYLIINYLSKVGEYLIEKGLIEKWFFIRYNDPEFHIRFRLRLKSAEKSISNTISTINEILSNEFNNKSIWDIQLGTYNRELERYGVDTIDAIENFFYYDTLMAISILKQFKNNLECPYWLYVCYSIEKILEIFDLNWEEKILLLEGLSLQFNKEFIVDKKLKKQIDKKYRSNFQNLKNLMNYELQTLLNEKIVHQAYDNMKVIVEKLNTKNIDLISSLVHMHINRIIDLNPRAHEMVIYNILLKFYRDESYHKQFNS